ncbi:lipopolysaccharide biosynthesis protein [Paraburkholderia pallida]|nr:lipopolysaccharide biosynthesis protein [Paraburkholderia pallida]
MSNVNGTLRRSVLINMVGRYSNIVIQLIVTAVLARVLSPKEFGLMAVVGVIAVFLSFLSEMGLGPAVVQFDELLSKQLAGLFWLTVVVGGCAGLALSLSGPLISNFYGDGIYSSIANGIAVNVAFSCWAIVPLALLRRRKRFHTIARIEVVAAAFSGICAVWSALHGGGVGALVLKGTSNAFFIFLFSVVLAKPPFCEPTLLRMGHVFSYSGYQFLFNFFNYFTRNADKLLIGKYLGSIPLGLYDMSYRLMLMPISNLTHVITPAIQPVYAEYAKNPVIIFESYQKLVRILAIGGGFVGAMCLGCAPEIILLSYGKQWAAAVPVFSIFSLSITVQVILSSTGSVFQALGKTKLLFVTGVFSTVTTVSAIVVGIFIGDLRVLASMVVASFFINFIQGFYVLTKFGFERATYDLFFPSMRTLVGVAVMSIIAIGLREQFPPISSEVLVRFIGKAGVIGGLYFVMICISGDATFIRGAVALRSRRLAK